MGRDDAKKQAGGDHMRLLLVEDEPAMSEALVDILTYHHYAVDPVFNGGDALYWARNQAYDGIILDIMLPGLDGLSVLRQLRSEGNATPVMLLTAKDTLSDKVQGLDDGADDLPKPFAMAELLACVKALVRRGGRYMPDTLCFGGLQLDRAHCALQCGERMEALSNLEYQLMEVFMRNPGMYFSAERLIELVWGLNREVETGSVWVYISYLRKKLQGLRCGVVIQSRRGVGYVLESGE